MAFSANQRGSKREAEEKDGNVVERKREPISWRSAEVVNKNANRSTAAGGTTLTDEHFHAERGRGKNGI